MQTRQLDRTEWSEYLSRVAAESVRVTVEPRRECAADSYGVWRALRRVRYDSDEDLLTVVASGRSVVRFFVKAPRRITLTDERAGSAITVTDRADLDTVIRFSSRSPGSPPAARPRLGGRSSTRREGQLAAR
ncbi:MAG: hypothetical protein QOK19_1970 [Solirubrobacteraceae bacterium]|nr:hypothetical protein [Solirubrobacterales bacterium]MEA2216409.1 hypothetical protein [Solirubrobacteraceae bacterium]